MFSALPASVREESRRKCEQHRMQAEDVTAPLQPMHNSYDSDSDLSCLSLADSTITRTRKLKQLVSAVDVQQARHIRNVKRGAQKQLNNVRCRHKDKPTAHLEGVVNDITNVLSWHTEQPRREDGKFVIKESYFRSTT